MGEPRAPGSLRARAARLWARIGASPLARRVAMGAFWNGFATVVSKSLAVLAAMLVARRLGVAGYGEFNLVQVTAGMFIVLSGLGLGTTATKYLAGRYRSDPPAAGRVVALSWLTAAGSGAVGTIAVALLAPWLARDVLHAPQIADALRIGSLLVVLGAVNGEQIGVLVGLERFRLLAVVSSLGALVGVPSMVVGARYGVDGAVIGTAAWMALYNLIQRVAVRRALREAGITPRYRSALRESHILFSFSVPATLSNMTLAPVTWATSAIIATTPDGLHELGIFAAGNQWRNAMLLVATAGTTALLPALSHLHDSGRIRAFSRACWTSFAATAAVCVAGALALSVLAPTIMRAYGAGFARGTGAFVLLVAGAAVAAPLKVIAQAIAGAGRMWVAFGLNVPWAATLVSATYLLRFRGAVGLATAYLVAYLVQLALSVAFATRLVRDGAARSAHAG